MKVANQIVQWEDQQVLKSAILILGIILIYFNTPGVPYEGCEGLRCNSGCIGCGTH